MTFASWVAMVAGMLLSLVDTYFLSRLNDVHVLSAMGFASSIGLFMSAIGIGLSVATSVLVSQKLTRSGEHAAHQLFTSIVLMGLLIGLLVMSVLLLGLPFILSILGAKGASFDNATSYLQLTLLVSPLGVLAMIFASGLRAAAMAKASMWISLIATIVNIILCPIFIEWFEWGIEGAAWATIVARYISFGIGIWYFGYRLRWFKSIDLIFVKQEFSGVRRITMPVLISNWFMPLGSMIVVWIVAAYGDEAMAGMAIVGSLGPVLFSVFFSITGAAGPMVGQNVGANQPARVGQIYRSGLCLIACYTLIVWVFGMLSYDAIADMYDVDGIAAGMIMIYCLVQIPLSMGIGAIALSNGIFNNLGKPNWSMRLSLARATMGTLLLCYVGSELFGLYGALIGSSLTFFVFGLFAVVFANRLFSRTYPNNWLVFSNRY